MTNFEANSECGVLETHLRQKRSEGRKLLLPYITGGYPESDWTLLIEGCISAGADAVEIGIPFSDPIMDGPTIQESSTLSLKAGTTPQSIFGELSKQKFAAPLIAMTYYNICYRMGHKRFASSLKEAGISAAILPDLSLEEVGEWAADAQSEGIENVMLAAPTSSDERLEKIAQKAQGFVYGVGLVGVTGERRELADSALQIAKRLKSITDKPVLVGVGVSNPQQALEVCEVADGVIIGSAVIRKILDSGSIDSAIEFLIEVRQALDNG